MARPEFEQAKNESLVEWKTNKNKNKKHLTQALKHKNKQQLCVCASSNTHKQQTGFVAVFSLPVKVLIWKI